MEVVISRSGYGGPAPAAKVTVDVGTVSIAPGFEAALGRATTVLHRTVASKQSMTLLIPVKRSPVRVEIHVDDATLIPPTPTDSRSLGVVVGFKFEPAAHRK